MDTCCSSPYELPTIAFVGGERKTISLHTYNYSGELPFDLTNCTCRFSMVHHLNQLGEPVLTKMMTVSGVSGETYDNVLTVELEPTDTVNLFGKYIYQVTIKDQDGGVEIPKKGVLLIDNNIDKSFITS